MGDVRLLAKIAPVSANLWEWWESLNRWCQSQKSGIRAAGLVLSGGNMAAEVEMEYNHMFANAINIPSQKSEGVRHRWLESCGNLDKTDAGRKIIARLLPSHPRYKLLPAQISTHGSRYDVDKVYIIHILYMRLA